MGIHSVVVFGWKEPRPTADILHSDWLEEHDVCMYFERVYSSAFGTDTVYGSAGCRLDAQTGLFEISAEERQLVIRAHAAYCSQFDCSPPLVITTAMSGDIDIDDGLLEYGGKEESDAEI